MTFRAFVLFSAGVLAVGCAGDVEPVAEPKLVDFVAEVETAVGDAQGAARSFKSAGERPASPDEESEDNPAHEVLASLQNVVSTAEQLVQSAAGSAAESDAKAVLADAQALVKKSQPTPKADDVLGGLEQISSKVQSLKARL